MHLAFISTVVSLVMAGLPPETLRIAASQAGAGLPAKLMSSCEIDLDGDRSSDLVLFVETLRGPEVLALIWRSEKYEVYVLSRGDTNSRVSCRFGSRVSETEAGTGKPEVVRTPGSYVVVAQPEGAARAFIWQGKAFRVVWIRD